MKATTPLRSFTRALFVSLLPAAAFAAPGSVDFQRDVQPILAEHCASCHGGVKKKGGLSLATRSDAFADTKSGAPAIVEGDAEASELIVRLITDDEDDRMPPEEPLSGADIDVLKRWVAEGAKWPEHWSLKPIANPQPPAVERADWVRNAVDRFVLARLESEGIKPSSEAAPRTLLRRLSLDLIGLAPDAARSDAFAAAWDKAGGVERERLYSEAVDELLNSPHFGERWGRHWLDEARYADSSGYEKDSARADAFHYRDWVINSLNADMPFDEFTIRQIAGDLLPGASIDDRVATQFHLMCQYNLEGGVDAEEDRTKRVADRVTTIGAVWLATTVECTSCHNHPYDPMSQRDFYRVYAFFNNTDPVAVFAGTPPTDAKKRLEERAKKWGPIADLIEQQVSDKNLATKLQGQLTQMRRYDNDKGFTRVLGERKENRRVTYLFHRGSFLQPDKESGEVKPAVPSAFPQVDAGGKSEADRLDFAKWLVAPENPLTSRVTVNKVWMRLFGAPLVNSVRDFGMRGAVPSHPELLDWLAHHFMHDAKWSRKSLIRLIVRSAAYRQSSHARPELAERDPDNRLLAWQARFRVEAEIVRDLFLQTAGLLSEKTGGPSVFPPLAADVAALSYANNFKWKTSPGEDRYRRGLYTFFKRTAPDPNLVAFDCPDASMTSPARGISNTPLQALTTLQNEVFHEAAQAFAKRLLNDASLPDDAARIDCAFALALGRPCDVDERKAMAGLLAEAKAYYAKQAEDAARLIGPHRAGRVSAADNAAWVAAVRVALNLDEFMTRS